MQNVLYPFKCQGGQFDPLVFFQFSSEPGGILIACILYSICWSDPVSCAIFSELHKHCAIKVLVVTRCFRQVLIYWWMDVWCIYWVPRICICLSSQPCYPNRCNWPRCNGFSINSSLCNRWRFVHVYVDNRGYFQWLHFSHVFVWFFCISKKYYIIVDISKGCNSADPLASLGRGCRCCHSGP